MQHAAARQALIPAVCWATADCSGGRAVPIQLLGAASRAPAHRSALVEQQALTWCNAVMQTCRFATSIDIGCVLGDQLTAVVAALARPGRARLPACP